MRTKLSLSLKISVVIISLVGVIWSFFNAIDDGYSHWTKRLLYFTSESNIWIAIVFAALIFVYFYEKKRGESNIKDVLYLIRYVFTISITLTGLIFCVVLAPGADNADYNAWTMSSIITHVIVPTLSIVDFFVDGYRITLKRRHILYTTIPPLAYLIFSSILGFCGVDFGRGDNFPYFFLNFKSPAGFFGTSDVMPYRIGSFYWLVFMLGIVLGFGALYKKLYKNKR